MALLVFAWLLVSSGSASGHRVGVHNYTFVYHVRWRSRGRTCRRFNVRTNSGQPVRRRINFCILESSKTKNAFPLAFRLQTISLERLAVKTKVLRILRGKSKPLTRMQANAPLLPRCGHARNTHVRSMIVLAYLYISESRKLGMRTKSNGSTIRVLADRLRGCFPHVHRASSLGFLPNTPI